MNEGWIESKFEKFPKVLLYVLEHDTQFSQHNHNYNHTIIKSTYNHIIKYVGSFHVVLRI